MENKIYLKCECGKDRKKSKGKILKTCGNKNCIKKLQYKRTHSEETKEKMRQKRFEYLKLKLGKTAWEKRSNKQMSYLENWFYTKIILKYELEKKYDIVNEYPFYPYFIDFAFLNIKLAVELDGACHFNNGDKRINSDIKKDKFLLNNGWTVFRISYKENNDNIINKFLNILNNIIVNDKLLEPKIYKGKINKIQKQRTQKEYYDEKRKNYILSQEKYKKQLLNSNIDFSKFGWVSIVSKIINQKPQKVNVWMKKVMPEFYKEKCFIRSGSSVRLEHLPDTQNVGGSNPSPTTIERNKL